MGLERIKRLTSQEPPVPVTEEAVKKQLALAAGTERFQHRDPIHHLMEQFQQTFDLMGQQRARSWEGPERLAMKEEVPQEKQEDEDRQALLSRSSMEELYEHRRKGGQGGPMDRFADVAFQRGNLSAAIVRGTGKMMLFSCLKRTVCQEQPSNIRERKLFQRSSSHRMVPGGHGAVSVVNRGFTDSAVGLVVDVLKDARHTLEAMEKMAGGQQGPDGVGTMEKQYPFLNDQKERSLLEQYRQQLEALRGPGHEEERQILHGAVEKTEAIIQKKDQMKRDFLHRLRELTRNAMEAEQLFSSREFLREAAKVVEQEEEPPEDDGEDEEPGGEEP